MAGKPVPLKNSRRGKPKKSQARMLPAARVAAAVETMAEPSGTARFAAGKALCITSEKEPGRVYGHFDAIAALLASECKIVCWNATQIIARLAPVDTQRKVDAILDRYLSFIRGTNLISAANAIGGAGKIALCRSDLWERIVPAMLAVEGATYETAECRNVAIGHALDSLAALGPGVCRRPDVAGFIQRQKGNTRAAVARRAESMAAELAGGG
jgi:hypothetical protein